MDSVAQSQEMKMVVEPKASSRPKKKKAQSQTDAKLKLPKIRQMEAKLCKWEEELKHRKANVNNSGTDQKRLEDYLQKQKIGIWSCKLPYALYSVENVP